MKNYLFKRILFSCFETKKCLKTFVFKNSHFYCCVVTQLAPKTANSVEKFTVLHSVVLAVNSSSIPKLLLSDSLFRLAVLSCPPMLNRLLQIMAELYCTE